jgi:hypothetical protein
MFYIIQFYKSLWQFKIKSIFFLITTIMLIGAIHFRQSLHQILSGGEYKKLPQFSALILKGADTPISVVAQRMKSLPGVNKIELNSNFKIDSASIQEADAELKSIIDDEYTVLKVFMDLNLNLEGQTLVQDFLKKLVGEDYITTSRIKNPSSDYKATPLWYQYKEWWAISFLISMWITLIVFLIADTDQNFKILSTFQRRKDIALKSYFVGLLTIIVPVYLAFISIDLNFNILNILLIVGLYMMALSMVQLRKVID